MVQSILKLDREIKTAVKLFLKMQPYHYGRNARHMVGLQPLFIHSLSVPREISFIYEYWSFKISQHILQVTSVYSVANAYYHCVVDVNPRFWNLISFSGWKHFIHIWRLLERGIESCLATCKYNYFSTGSVCPFLLQESHLKIWNMSLHGNIF